MLTLDPNKLASLEIPIGTGWLLGACMEAHGKQDLWLKQKPEVLEVLREQAIIQSAESSNRIEGVTVASNRLRPLVIGRARPRDRSEEELDGYRAALEWIFLRERRVPPVARGRAGGRPPTRGSAPQSSFAITPEVVRRLHALAQGGSSRDFGGDAGEWKARDNEIAEILTTGERILRFVPVSAKETPVAVKMLCDRYRTACDEGRIPPLLIVATFVLDLLCIHPFRDGNGRVSRLTTSLLLQSHGFQVVRYISLERLIEESKEEYYRVLKRCSQGWHEGKNEIIPWWNYFLGTLRSAYKELERQIETAVARPAKRDLVRQKVLVQSEPFTLADMAAQLPVASS
ncbi:MAG TPA: Fic family protein, partial [Bryobacteraceae bacterium]|nr:Fic family protein [Bryobacteraceae bacterium]